MGERGRHTCSQSALLAHVLSVHKVRGTTSSGDAGVVTGMEMTRWRKGRKQTKVDALKDMVKSCGLGGGSERGWGRTKVDHGRR